MTDSRGNGTPSRPDIDRPTNTYERLPDGQPRFQGCSKISAYEFLGKLGEGTFGEVHKARHIKKGHLVALKKILMHNEKDGFPITALREIKLLKMLSHPNVLKLEEMAVEHRRGEGKKKAYMYMVMLYMDHDLSGLLENPAVHMTEPQIKCYMLQLLEGVRYLHAQKILHRDMKAANLLINNKGILQIADFGLARPYDEDSPQAGKGGGVAVRDYTTLVVTRWYRPPELLLQLRKYTTAIDMWGVGCVFGEMFRRRPILAGKSDLNQLQQIFDLVGSPTEENMPGWSELPGFKKDGVTSYGLSKGRLAQAFKEQGPGVISLLSELLKLDWRKRINAIDALEHPYFKSHPLPAKPGDIPQFEESHELDRRKFRDQQAALPPAPAGGTVGMGPQTGEWASAAHTNGYSTRRPQGNPNHPPRRDRDFDRRGPHPLQRDRGPGGGPDRDRRPAWDRNRPQNQPNLDLPPKPPVDANRGGPDGESQNASGRPRHGHHPARHNGPPPYGGSNVDTYIPSYGAGEERGRHDRNRAWERNAGLPYDGPSRDRSRSPAGMADRGRQDRNREGYRRAQRHGDS
jgi:serine/threonine-protein kinase BUR1